MNKKKKYYYIKLKKELFDDNEAMDFLLSQEDGSRYAMIYILLCLKTLNSGGLLASSINEIIVKFTPEKIAKDLKYFSIDTIRVALELFKGLGLIYEEKDGNLKISRYDELIGNETNWAVQKREQRKKGLPQTYNTSRKIQHISLKSNN